jgi:hypothetical protein
MCPLRIVVALLSLGGTAAAEGPKRVRLVTHAGGYMHDSGLVACSSTFQGVLWTSHLLLPPS